MEKPVALGPGSGSTRRSVARSLLGPLSAMLGDWMGPVQLRIDEDGISELAEDRARLFASVTAADFLTRAEKRKQLGFEPDEEALA